MTPDQFRTALTRLGWSARAVQAMCGRSRRGACNWTSTGPPADVAAWVQRRLDDHDAMMTHDPPPQPRVPGMRNEQRKDIQ